MDEDQDATTPPAATTPQEKRHGDKETSTGKLVKLRAFNIFASRVRDSVKDKHPVANGHEIKRIVGQKWAELGSGIKKEFIDVAQSENDMLEKMPVDPSAPKRKRRRKPKSETILGDATSDGRKQKAPARLRDAGGVNGEARHEEEVVTTRVKNIRKKELPRPSSGMGNVKRAAGRSGSDVYIMTVRVGDTDMIFRGVMFDPFHSRAPAKTNDLGTGVKSSKKSDGFIYPSTAPSSSKQIHNSMSGGLPSVK